MAPVLVEGEPVGVPGRRLSQDQSTFTSTVDRTHRREDPEYLAKGWCIGSGAVESACKTVVGHRQKQAGMRWGEDGAHALCHLRALYRSEKGQWDAFWRRDLSRN